MNRSRPGCFPLAYPPTGSEHTRMARPPEGRVPSQFSHSQTIMIFDRSDNEILAVVHRDDELQKLLRRFRRLRVMMWIAFDGLLLISAISLSWLAHAWSQAADSNLQTFYSSLIEFFALISAPVLVGLLLVAIAADGRVKLLLLFRALRDGRNLPVAAPAA